MDGATAVFMEGVSRGAGLARGGRGGGEWRKYGSRAARGRFGFGRRFCKEER